MTIALAIALLMIGGTIGALALALVAITVNKLDDRGKS